MRAVRSADRNPPTAVVFGAAGFVGRNVCVALWAAGWSVVPVTRRRTDDLPTGPAHPPDPPAPVLDPPAHPPDPPPPAAGSALSAGSALVLDPVQIDAGTLAAALAERHPTLVVNAAGALWDVTDDELTAGNVTLVDRLVRAVATLPGPVRLVHLGSAYEYGGQPGRVRLPETLKERPTSEYARTKLAGTRLITNAVAEGRVDATVLRIATSVGPFAPRQSLLGAVAHQLAARPAVLDLPPLDAVRDIVDVRDVADAVLAAATATRVPPVVNIGAGTAVALNDVVDALIRIAGSTATITRHRPPAVRRDAGIGGQPLDIGLARRRLGWSPVRTVPDALRGLWDSVASISTSAVDGETIHG